VTETCLAERPDLPIGATVRARDRAGCCRVVELEACVWNGDSYDSEVFIDTTTGQVAAAIRLLNGRDRNDLYLREASGSWIGIGGGPSLFMVTFAASADGPLFQAVDPSTPFFPEVAIVVGGQEIRCSLQDLVGIVDATTAACDFVRTGLRSKTVQWRAR
jgi:hypothetical protein